MDRQGLRGRRSRAHGPNDGLAENGGGHTGRAPCGIEIDRSPDGAGRLQLPLTLPLGVDQVDLLLRAPGYRGPYTEESLRAVFGPCAPAARLGVPVGALADVVLTLEENAP